MMIEVNSLKDFKEKKTNRENFWLLIHKENSEQSDCANKNISDAVTEAKSEVSVFVADVNKV
ncbi:MAG: hypothetical protein J7K64_04370, partial [Bacteroidales bacterium]|nr:hypothetical protein [Bacteroidales bacterium]